MSSTRAALERNAGSVSVGRALYLRCVRCTLPETAAWPSEAANDRQTAVVMRPNQRARFIEPCASLFESVECIRAWFMSCIRDVFLGFYRHYAPRCAPDWWL